MKAERFAGPMFVMSLLAVLGLTSHARAADEIISPMADADKANCQSVHAIQEERVIVDCPSDQKFNFCFTRKTVDRAGTITGQMEFFSDPTKEAGLQHAPHQLQYGLVINLVTESGVLQMEENGIWDTESKDWAGLSTISGGTGDFEGATGQLATFGNTDAGGMVIGTICKE